MKGAAQSLSEKRRVRSNDEIVAALAGVHQQGDIKIKVRRGDQRLVFEFHCAVEDAGTLLAGAEELKPLLKTFVDTLRHGPRMRKQ